MGWYDMVQRLRKATPAKAKADTVDKLAAQVAAAELERSTRQHEIERLEGELQAAMIAALEGGTGTAADRLRSELRIAREDLADSERLVAALQSRLAQARHNADAIARARRLADAREAADGMTHALKQLTAGADLIVSGARAFYAARSRFFEVCPEDIKPAAIPNVWANPETYLRRYVGARCPIFRGDAVRGTTNFDRLALIDEMAELHADALAQVFPTNPPSKAA